MKIKRTQNLNSAVSAFEDFRTNFYKQNALISDGTYASNPKNVSTKDANGGLRLTPETANKHGIPYKEIIIPDIKTLKQLTGTPDEYFADGEDDGFNMDLSKLNPNSVSLCYAIRKYLYGNSTGLKEYEPLIDKNYFPMTIKCYGSSETNFDVYPNNPIVVGDPDTPVVFIADSVTFHDSAQILFVGKSDVRIAKTIQNGTSDVATFSSKGNNGTNGTSGGNGTDGSSGGKGANGAAGTSGTAGTDGTKGGNSFEITASLLEIQNRISVASYGGNGGNGAGGGKGGNGGNGGNNTDKDENGGNGGKGGDGGSGGNGGDAGNGAVLTITCKTGVQNIEIFSATSFAGAGGSGGSAGSGGNGGKGDNKDGTPGTPGNPGNPGKPGNPGVNGKINIIQIP